MNVATCSAIGVALLLGACSTDGTKSVQAPFDCTTGSMRVTPPSATLHPGDSLKEAASFAACPYDGVVATFRWRSSNTGVAIVDSMAGLVRAVDTGSVTIIATVTENPAVQGAAALTVIP
jgi:uncharacterized protein YjdB